MLPPGRSLGFEVLEQPAGDAPSAEDGQGEHPLEFAVVVLQHDRTTRDGPPRFVPRHGKEYVGPAQCLHADAVVTFQGIERSLVGIQLVDERDAFGLDGSLQGDAHDVGGRLTVSERAKRYARGEGRATSRSARSRSRQRF